MGLPFSTQQGRRPDRLPAHVLVLLPPGGLHHDSASVWDDFRDFASSRPQADFWVSGDRLLQSCYQLPGIDCVGTPHVHQWNASWLRMFFMIMTMIIAVPTGIKVFSWLATIWGGKLRLNSAMLFAMGFVSMFVIGGISGVMVASVPFDLHVHDTYFIVAHIHYVLFGGSVFGLYAGALPLVSQNDRTHAERNLGQGSLYPYPYWV